MKKSFLVLAILVATTIADRAASAQDWKSGSNSAQPASASAATKIVRLSGSITGTVESTSGGCTTGFSNQCPSGHICGCLTAMGAKFSSSAFGTGTANLFGTIDSTATFGTAGACAPVYVEIDIAAKKDSPTFDAVGALCFEPNGSAILDGGMGLVVATSKLFTTSGSAGFTAALTSPSGLSGGTFRMALSFKGTAE